MLVKINKIILLFSFLFSLTFFSLIGVNTTMAKGDDILFTPQVSIPNSDFKQGATTTIEDSTATIGKYIRSIYNYLLAIVGLVAAIVLMLGGVIWLTAAGNTDKIGQAKNLIGGSLTGLVLALSSFLILKTINPFLVDFQNEDIVKIDTVLSCCNPTEGLKSGALDKNNKYVCPTGSTVCQEKEECTKLSGKETWQCLSEQQVTQTYRCCEYTDGWGNLTCVDEKKELTCPDIGRGQEWVAVYEGVLCDSDGTGRVNSTLSPGGKCHYPGPKKCCQCRFDFTLGIAFQNTCRDDYSEGRCYYWCEWYSNGSGWEATHTDTKCNNKGYCR